MERHGIIKYPKFINEIAVYIGKLRNLFDYNITEEKPEYSRGDKNDAVSILGVKCELIFAYYLASTGREFRMNRLLDARPVHSWDIQISNFNVDVKGHFADSQYLCVNVDAHKSSKNVNLYALILLVDETTVEYWLINYHEVDKWEIKEFKYNKPAFAIQVALLHSVTT